MPRRFFDDMACTGLATAYPERPTLLRHGLAGHPLFELSALLKLSQRLNPDHVEHNLGALPIGIDAADVPKTGLSAEETIRSIAANGSWMVLKFVEQDPPYRALLHGLLRELAPVIAPATGAMLKKEAFIFVSSPQAVTPFHFDPEHNILLQLRGEKVMTLFPAGDERVVDSRAHERFHLGGHRNLPFDEAFLDHGREYRLRAGDALYVPVKAPHFVRNGDQVSVSLSITWRSEWSYREADAHGFNALLRRAGLTPAATRRYPKDNRLKSIGYRVIRKARHIVVRGN